MKIIKRAFLAISVCLSFAAHSQSLGNLPSGYIGYVGNPATGVNNSYTFSFTAANSGSDYVGFAFRQDPAFWSFTNPSVTAAGSSTNLLTNASLTAGGPVQVTVNSGTQTIQAPTNWGVWYQNGTYPAAAGTWQSGQWYDGAVGTYDGIYQGINVNSGITYTVTFNALSTSQAGSLEQAIIGVYAGACTNVTLAASSCVPVTSSGFTPIAQPNQTVNAGNPSAPPVPPTPSAPTVVSTANGTPTVVSTTADGATVATTASTRGTTATAVATTLGATAVATAVTDSRANQTAQNLNINRNVTVTSTTPVTTVTTSTTPITTVTTYTTPRTTTTVTTPTLIDTYSDGSTQTRTGTPVTTTSTTTIVTTSTAVVNEVVTATAHTNNVDVASTNQGYSTRIDQFSKLSSANNRMNESLESDPYTRIRVEDGQIHQRDLSGRDYNFYVTGSGLKSNTKDTYNYTGSVFGLGIEKLIDPTVLVGAQYNHGQVNLSGDQAAGTMNKDAVGVYVVKSFENDVMVKGDIGYAQNTYNTAHSLPALNYGNAGSANGTDSWAQVKVYAPAVAGFRAFVGGRSESNQIDAVKETGSAVTAMTYAAVNQVNNSGIGGVRYDHNFNKNWAVGAEVGYYTNNTTASAVNFTYHDDKNSSVLLKIARQDVQGQAVNTASLQARVNF